MRIALIAPPWLPVPPVGYGGTEAVLDNLARGLVADGHELLLFTTGDSTCPVPRRWVRPHAAGTVDTGAATELHHVINAYDDILDWGPDVVHDHTLVGPVYAQRFDLPVVTTNHGPFEGELRAFYDAIAPRVPVIAISEHHARTAEPIAVAAVIHHGIDVDSFPMGDGDGGYALFLGRMSPDKGVARAVHLAREAGIPLKIAAKMREAGEHAYFQSTVKPLLGDDVEYLGEVGGADKLTLLGGARCLLNPIVWPEPFGMVMIEALACGTPVLASDHGSAPEIVVDGVTGAICTDDGCFVDALTNLDRYRRTACRRDAGERFSSRRMVERHVELFAEVCHRRELLPG